MKRSVLVSLAVLITASASWPGKAADSTEPRLMGIVVAGPLRQAIFADPDGKSAQSVQEGEQIGTYRVYLITPREVGLEGPAGRRLVQPGVDPAIREALAYIAPPVPVIDPYRREAETENDQ